MNFIVTLKDSTEHKVSADSFNAQVGVVTFVNQHNVPVAAFCDWCSVKPDTEQQPQQGT